MIDNDFTIDFDTKEIKFNSTPDQQAYTVAELYSYVKEKMGLLPYDIPDFDHLIESCPLCDTPAKLMMEGGHDGIHLYCPNKECDEKGIRSDLNHEDNINPDLFYYMLEHWNRKTVDRDAVYAAVHFAEEL